MMEAAGSSETLVSHRNTIRCDGPKDFYLNRHCIKTSKSRIYNYKFIKFEFCQPFGLGVLIKAGGSSNMPFASAKTINIGVNSGRKMEFSKVK
jgi:hypothetical protein